MKGGKSKADTSKKSETKLSVKRKGSKAPQKPAKREKAGKDPNKPKRPPSAFFVFMEEFRKSYKEKNPNVNKVAVIGKAGGEKWKSLSTVEKGPYEAKAAKLKTEYNKKMDAYNNQSESGNNAADDEEETSDKSKSEVNDEDNEDEEEESGEDEDDDE
ncbi:HMG1/2-like protein [Dioscorea cayenensis subsp. rotundata]|uniref:HMG1/2-like protein n=1 Tax=Dioscorea cayennensis subsp. rotundata TaxID=55577 RepID=A0AB40C3V9_DIOCR|nr:HMG1/2-like protein [Dioscorea cayenensis subsp. rotundata]